MKDQDKIRYKISAVFSVWKIELEICMLKESG